ncbi:molybdopterin-containing oxidoreductase family protein [Patulibacter minatonensis]|uniref:molybdopterin-containing oxidoreductase family protein n=1 Tax=Patulibacter minatonensis TaxID=298163 RepID=UPI0004B54316|nr:molybdopterin-dependent oxidoreductase [Patulibacter minatonensis]
MTKTVNTYCRICVATCGLNVTVDEETNAVLDIEPDRENPYTWRDFCRKGKTANEVATHPQRITTPMRRVGDRYVPATYEEATADIAARLNAIIERDGPDAVGSYNGNPMGFTFSITAWWTGLLDAIGTGNRFWVGSIDQNNAHVVAEHLYGNELVSLVPDIDHCGFFLFVGMDPATSKFNWMENNPSGWNRVLEKQRAGATVVVVDPRRSVSAETADQHLAVLPGGDWALLLSLVKVILEERLERPADNLPLTGLEDARRFVGEFDGEQLATLAGVEREVLADLARRFAAAPTAMCVTHTGVSMNEHGTIGEWLSHTLNLITGRIDNPGGRRFERGFVDIALVMKMFAPAAEHHTRLRGNPTIAGFHSIAELPDEITTAGKGQIRGFLMAFGNPVVSGPDGQALDDALQDLDLLVAIDLVQRESHRHADWLIPGTHWLEREDLHPLFANLQERPYVNYAEKAIDPPAGVKEEWEFFADLALAMDRNLFGKPGVNRIIRASRRLAKLTGRPKLAMNPEWVQRLMVRIGRRIRWKDIKAHPHGWIFGEPEYGDLAGILATDDKRVQLAPRAFLDATREAVAAPPVTGDEFPLLLTTKRIREAMNSWLNESDGLFRPERTNVLEMNGSDAAALGVRDGDLVRVRSATGKIELRARLSDVMRPGTVCAPHGWGSRIFDPAGTAPPRSYGTNRNLLVSNTRLDRFSQTPALNSTAVSVELATDRLPDRQVEVEGRSDDIRSSVRSVNA